MLEFLEAVDRAVKPLVGEINGYMKRLRVDRLVTFYDTDWGGIPTQIVVDRICEKIHGEKPDCHWINYSRVESAVALAQDRNFPEVCFLEYEPHEKEIDGICRGAETVGIFGHHKDRDDVKKLCTRDFRFSYFNPRDYTKEIKYERGIPILYPFLKAAESHGLDVRIIGGLGLRGYGYKKLFEEKYPELNNRRSTRILDTIIENVNLLVNHRFKNCSIVVELLGKVGGLESESLEKINALSRQKKLAGARNKAVVDSILHSEIYGDVQIFPVRTDFDSARPFVSDLTAESSAGGYKTAIIIHCRNGSASRKVSIRTSAKVDVPEILRDAHEGHKYKNFGGHEKSGGFVCDTTALPEILAAFLNKYFFDTISAIHVEPSDFYKMF